MDIKIENLYPSNSFQAKGMRINTEDGAKSELSHGEILQQLKHVHYPSGFVYQELNKQLALLNLEKKELAAIYHLKESHAPGLRSKAAYRYSKQVAISGDTTTLKKKHIDFTCNKFAGHDNVSKMLQQVWDMPKEWTLVQITTKCNPEENASLVSQRSFTYDLHISVFQCGKQQDQPFCITVLAPHDAVTGDVMNIKDEMLSILKHNKEMLAPRPRTAHEKKSYCEARLNLNNRLKSLVKDMQNFWLAGWRCLLMGKLSGQHKHVVEEILQTALKEIDRYKITEKVKSILRCLIKASNYLKILEIRQVVSLCFPDDRTSIMKVAKVICDFSKDSTFFTDLKIHPVILILDEKLDIFPWEMIDVLLNHPVSRMPSLHFTYALFKQYEHSVANGIMTGVNANNGKYIINPSLDLEKMEKRITNFIQNRIPSWSGLVHVKPQAGEMGKCIVDCDIFSYYGHGNGSQFLTYGEIKKLPIQSVVCLFGCSSASYVQLGPQVEMYGAHQMYLLAGSPCIIGALWVVTDSDTDVLSTEFFDMWMPPAEDFDWKEVNKKLWDATGEIQMHKKGNVPRDGSHEPELLRALCKAKKRTFQYLTQAAFVARGLPVSV